MLERSNDRVGWWRKKQGARDNIPKRYHNGFEGGRRKHRIDDTEVEMGSNDVNSTPIEIGSTLYVQHIDKRYHRYSKEVEVKCLE